MIVRSHHSKGGAMVTRKNILDRYETAADGRVVIDVSVSRIEDLYSYFDRTAPYLKKDLDEEFTEYLVSCVREIGSKNFVIRLNLETMPDNAGIARVEKSINNYFLYLQEVEHRNMKKMFRTSSILFFIGMMVLSVSIWMGRVFSLSGSVIFQLFSEGTTVAAWVSLWEALATLLIQWPPHRREIRLFSRIAGAPVIFSAIAPEIQVPQRLSPSNIFKTALPHN